MTFELQKQTAMDPRGLNWANYLPCLLETALHAGQITQEDISAFQRQCASLLARQTHRYTCGKSSSIPIKKAEQLTASLFYCTGARLKVEPSMDAALQLLFTNPLDSLFQSGLALVNAQVRKDRQLLSSIQRNCLKTPNLAYNDTLFKGLSPFFEQYSPEFDAQSIPGSIDYPLSREEPGLTGIEFISDYLHALYLENQFCRLFQADDIHRMMLSYDLHYEDLLINLYEQTLMNALGCILLRLPPRTLWIPAEGRAWLLEKLSCGGPQVIEALLRRAAQALVAELGITSGALTRYLDATLHTLAVRLASAVQNGTLDKLLVTPLAEHTLLEEGAVMDSDAFRVFLEELSSCRYLSDKLAMIHSEIHSLTDMQELLDSGILQREEQNALLSALSPEERALLRLL